MDAPLFILQCRCGDDQCIHFEADYPWCRPCGEHHRPPECASDQTGAPLAPCGCRWDDVDQQRHRDGCYYAE